MGEKQPISKKSAQSVGLNPQTVRLLLFGQFIMNDTL